jgi:hypothetical protein
MWWALLALAAAQEPSPATVVYYNARMALAEGESLEAAKLWLLRNALANQTGAVSDHDADFRSVTWAALGDLGICTDGLLTDDDGAGLWPLAMHNWVVRNRGRKATGRRPRPFEAFDVGRQQRFVSIDDVLASRELAEVSLFRGKCGRQRILLALAGESPLADLGDRQVAARLLLNLLQRAEETLADERVRGKAVLEARRFDLYLQLSALSAKEARQEARTAARTGRAGGLSRESAQAILEEAPDYAFAPSSEPARILRECVGWSVEEWMALTPERRRFLFLHARAYGGDPALLDAIALGVIDASIVRGEGKELTEWIGLRSGDPATLPETVWGGARGERLLSMDGEAGFGERGVIALHRGIRQLEEGDLPAALRSLAYALQHAQESTAAEEVERLSRRWLSHVAGRFALTDELLVTLRALVPVRDYAIILEDLLWRSAFHADAASFARGVEHQPGSGALERRAALLRPLASGDITAFSARIRAAQKEAPSETLRFVDQLLDRLELEDADVRRAQVQTLKNLEALLVAQAAASEGRQERTLDALLERCRAIRAGAVGAVDTGPANPWSRVVDDARALAPDREVFLGAVRLAPADPLPWPFRASDVAAPSVFDPLRLVPVLWQDERGERVFGWGIEG